MQADTTRRSAPATRSHGCRQSPSLTFRCLPTTLFLNRNTSAPGACSTAWQADAVVAPDPIMAAQRPSFPAMSVVALSDSTQICAGRDQNRGGGDPVVSRGGCRGLAAGASAATAATGVAAWG